MTRIEGVSSRPVRRLVLMGDRRVAEARLSDALPGFDRDLQDPDQSRHRSLDVLCGFMCSSKGFISAAHTVCTNQWVR
jgi:hypothetical protein